MQMAKAPAAGFELCPHMCTKGTPPDDRVEWGDKTPAAPGGAQLLHWLGLWLRYTLSQTGTCTPVSTVVFFTTAGTWK